MIHYCRYLFVKMKVFNYSELHFSEVTFYRIHTLAGMHFDAVVVFVMKFSTLFKKALDILCSSSSGLLLCDLRAC